MLELPKPDTTRKKVAGRKKQAAQHICFRTSERKNNEDEPKEKLFLLS